MLTHVLLLEKKKKKDTHFSLLLESCAAPSTQIAQI